MLLPIYRASHRAPKRFAPARSFIRRDRALSEDYSRAVSRAAIHHEFARLALDNRVDIELVGHPLDRSETCAERVCCRITVFDGNRGILNAWAFVPVDDFKPCGFYALVCARAEKLARAARKFHCVRADLLNSYVKLCKPSLVEADFRSAAANDPSCRSDVGFFDEGHRLESFHES